MLIYSKRSVLNLSLCFSTLTSSNEAIDRQGSKRGEQKPASSRMASPGARRGFKPPLTIHPVPLHDTSNGQLLTPCIKPIALAHTRSSLRRSLFPNPTYPQSMLTSHQPTTPTNNFGLASSLHLLLHQNHGPRFPRPTSREYGRSLLPPSHFAHSPSITSLVPIIH